MKQVSLITIAFLCTFVAACPGKEWSDSSGHYSLEADLIAFNDNIVVLKKKNRDLVSLPVDKLSEADREYLRSREAADVVRGLNEGLQTWTTRGGLKIRGKVVSYVRKDVTIQRRRGRVYVNDHLFDNLPGVYREIIPQIVAHFENVEIADKQALQAWTLGQKGAAKTYTCDGVMMELESGDMYGVPFFLFSDEDLKILQPGWEAWLAVQDDSSAQSRRSFELESQAQAYQQDRQAVRQVMQLQLQLQAYQAGLFDLWEVAMYPTVPGYAPMIVVVPGRNSQQAQAAAIMQYPNYTAGPTSRVSRK